MSDGRIDPRVEVGRVILDVADAERARAFYEGVLGFKAFPRAGRNTIFLSAGGGHHQIVLRGPAALDAQSVPVASGFALRLPDRRALAEAVIRLTAAAVPLDQAYDLGSVESVSVRDPDGHRIELYCERVPSEWPADADDALRASGIPLDLESLRAGVLHEEVAAGAQEQSGTAALSELTRARLREMRTRLLNLHKVLLDDTRAAYEMDRGHVRSNASLLQLVINDPWFAWLHPLSELVVRIDEVLQPDAPATEADGGVLLDHVARLLSPGQHGGRFAERYYEALQRQPAVVVAHAEVRRILKEAR